MLRLPTQAEWEYAARGGAAVDAAAFREPRYPMGARPLHEYEAMGDSVSANGKVQPIGTLRANPLGLHDMLGNVSELTLEPFRLVRKGRLHGRIGGWVKRGGDARSDASRIAAATREELRFIDPTTGEPVRDRFVRFRLVISAVALDGGYTQAQYAAANAAAAAPDTGAALGREEARALDALAQAAEVENLGDRRRMLRDVAARLDAVRAERNEQRDRAASNMLFAAAYVRSMAHQETKILDLIASRSAEIRALYERFRLRQAAGALSAQEEAAMPRAAREVARAEAKRGEVDGRIDAHLAAYVDLVNTLRTDYGAGVIDAVERDLAQRLTREGPPIVAACLGIASAHVDQARLDGRLRSSEWRSDFATLRR